MYFDSLEKNECSGCTACMNACPKAAITMQEDSEGFLYPHIDENTCIHCGLCQKVCSWEHPTYNNSSEPLTLASILQNKAERQRSTSGGVFYAIAKWIIEQNGVVYGAAFDEKLQLHHISADNLEDLQRLRGSKYIQSNLGHIFKEVRSQLEQGRWCYFTGTGCQVAGLKAYLHKDYEKLLCSDLVCHGVPSQKLFNEHIAYMEQKYHDNVVGYLFRDYKGGGVCETICFKDKEKVVNSSYELSPFLYSFMCGYTYRYSCYGCKFAKIPRQGDITLADYWGVQHYLPEFDKSCGVSLVLLNSSRGAEMWEKVKRTCVFNVSKIEEAAVYNLNLLQSSKKPEIRDLVYDDLFKKGYSYIARELFRPSNIKYYWVKLKTNIVRMRILRYPLYLYRLLKNARV